jgi:glycosyltransferase involved in cell wall biosynthesis
MDKPEFSIVIPCYNGFDNLKRLLEQLHVNLAAVNDKIEVIVVDDGSDNIFQGALPNFVSLFRKENGGVSSARNYGLERATGQYILFLDCDDELTDDFYCLVSETVHDTRSDMYVFSHKQTKGKYTIAKPNKVHTNLSNNEATAKILSKEITFHNCSVLYKLDFLKLHQLKYDENLSYSEDVHFILSAVTHCSTMTSSDKFIYNYIDNENGTINSPVTKKYLNSIEAFNKISEIALPTKLKSEMNWFLIICTTHCIIRLYKHKNTNEEVFSEFIQHIKTYPTFPPKRLNFRNSIVFTLKMAFSLPSALFVGAYKLK